MPGENYCRWLRSLLLYLCDVFRALINCLVCWFSNRVTNEGIREVVKSINSEQLSDSRCTSGGVYAPCIYTHGRWVTVGDSSLLLYLCDVFLALINSLVCWFSSHVSCERKQSMSTCTLPRWLARTGATSVVVNILRRKDWQKLFLINTEDNSERRKDLRGCCFDNTEQHPESVNIWNEGIREVVKSINLEQLFDKVLFYVFLFCFVFK